LCAGFIDPVHILHVIGSLSPADGGPPEAVRQLMRAYPEIGVSAEVLCQDPPGAPFLQTVPCPVHALGQRWLGRFGLSPRLWQWIHHNAPRFDALVQHGVWIFTNPAVRSAARRAAIPYAVFPHGGLDPWFNKKYPLKHLKKILYWPIQYPVLRDARAVLFTTPTERDLAVTSFRPNRWNSIPVPYGTSEPEGDPASQIEAFYGKVSALRGRRYLLFLARLHEKKGCDLLLQAFAKIAPTAPEIDLVMAGPDQVGLQAKLQLSAAQQGIAARVHWPGMLAGDLKWGALRAADAFVLPSHQENFGISVVEALAARRPVLISNQVNIWPDIQSDGAGLVDDDTLAGTGRLLSRWLALPATERDAMAARAHPCFASRYSMKSTALLIRNLFRPPAPPSSSSGA
jgi:glycosyltransferase involved in cell wall biosynthesis